MNSNVTIIENVETPMRDGTVLRADVFMPSEGGPFPALLSRGPYNKIVEDSKSSYQRLAAAGYAVVAQDIRDRYASDGEFHPMFNFGWTDAEDGYDTVEWVAAQEWCNGKIGTYGYSYSAWTQWALAPTKPPHLVCMFVGGMAPKSTDWEMGGVFRAGRAIPWLLGQMAPDTQKFLDEPEGPTTASEYTSREVGVDRYKWLWFLPWSDLPLEATGDLRKKIHGWLRDHHRDMWGFDDRVGDIDVPVFHRTGWYDRLSRTTKLFEAMTARGPTLETKRSQRMVVGPWMHSKAVTRKQGEMDFGEDSVVDFFDQLIAWADYWLKDIDNGMMDTAPVRVFVMGENRWRDESEWPPIRAVPTDFYLHSGGSANRPSGDGLLSTVPQGDESSDAYSYDPRNPVMSMFSKRGHDEPHDLRPLDRRRDVLVYQTAPLVEAVEVTGYPVVTLCASSSAVDTDFIVRLVDVHPDGFSQNLSYGIVRARYRNGFESPGLMTPGQVYEFTIEMLPTGNVFLPGHRIRLDVTSSDFPNFDRNHNTGGDDWQDAELVTAHQTVHHDASWQSRVTLPIVPR